MRAADPQEAFAHLAFRGDGPLTEQWSTSPPADLGESLQPQAVRLSTDCISTGSWESMLAGMRTRGGGSGERLPATLRPGERRPVPINRPV
jgi:hypothetical protein